MRSKNLSIEKRKLIWKLAEKGKTLSNIASLLDTCKSTVNSTLRLIREKKSKGIDPFQTVHRTGRPPLLSVRAHRRLIRFARNHREATLEDLARKDVTGTRLSTSTVRKELKKDGLHRRKARKKCGVGPC